MLSNAELQRIRQEDSQDHGKSFTYADKACHKRFQRQWNEMTRSTEMRFSDEYTQEYDKARHIGSYHATARQRKKMEAKYDT
jgi:hypothetical protein